MAQTLIFDGHVDTLLSMRTTGRSFFEASDQGHVDLPRARDGGLAGAFFSIWVPDPGHEPIDDVGNDPDVEAYTSVERMPPPMSLSHAEHYALQTFHQIHALVREAQGAVAVATTADQVRRNLEQGVFTLELHMEGAEPIDPSLDTLEAFVMLGVRSIGLVWSRPNAFGFGVPFQFPATPDIGPGLTEAGKQLVQACNALGVIVDVSHLNEAGFWDVVSLSQAPIVATHSGAHAITPSTRNLTDRQLDAIRDSDGIVGVNFHVGFVHPDGLEDGNQVGYRHIADHVEYLLERLGPSRVALGSDFDGATMPSDMPDCAHLPRLIEELRRRGHDDALIEAIAHGNWVRIMEATWQA